MEQLTFWDVIYPTKIINKPIRLIELFSGIGSQAKALEILGISFEHHKTCEWAYNSILSYNAIHIKDFTDYSKDKTKEDLIKYLNGNISTDYNSPCECNKKSEEWLRKVYNSCIATHNLMNIMNVKGSDLEINEKEKYEYILTYSFPCQDLSLAGLRKGMSVSQADGGTRSGLLWEVERILTELDKEHRPDILLMENVPEVCGTNNVKDFVKWQLKLKDLGYKNYFEILNAKNYCIPQNRRRCFMVSILGDYSYQFPTEIKLKYKLKDLLEKEVDEKYYLSDKMIKYISANNEKWTGNNGGSIVNKDIGCTINTAPTQRRCDASNYIRDNLPDNADLKQYNNKALNETIENNKIEDGDFIDAFNRDVKKDVAGTIKTTVNTSNMTFVAEDKVINVGNYGNGHHAKDISSEEGIAPTITTGNHGLGQTIEVKNDRGGKKIMIKNNTSIGYLEATEGDGVDISGRMEHHRGNVQKGLAQTIKTSVDVGVVVKDTGERESK